MKSKEEILKPFIYKKVEAFGEAVTPDGALEAMEEHARNRAVEFLKWISENDWERSTKHPDKWYCGKDVPYEYKSYEEVVEIFEQSLK